MSALAVSALPADELHLPVPEQVAAVLAALDAEEIRSSLGDLLGHMDLASRSGDWRPVQEVLEAWYRSALVVRRLDVSKLEATGDAYTAEEVRERLGLG